MATTWTFDDPIPYPAEKVWALITDAGFMERWTIVQGGQDPRGETYVETPEKRSVRLKLKEPVNVPGFNMTIDATMEFHWDNRRKMGDWKRVGIGVDVWGVTEVVADGDGKCRFIERGNVQYTYHVPFIGGRVESGVVDHLKKGRRKKLDFLLDALKSGG